MQNMILVAGEDDNFNIVDQWESVTEVDVQTPREVCSIPSVPASAVVGFPWPASALPPVPFRSDCLCGNPQVYAELQQDGYDVDYVRVPLTDEKAPKEKDFDKLIKRCWSMPPGAAVVFNCQMGRGRTTTGRASPQSSTSRNIATIP